MARAFGVVVALCVLVCGVVRADEMDDALSLLEAEELAMEPPKEVRKWR